MVNKEKRKAYIQEYFASDLSQRDFANSKGISTSTLKNWLKDYEEQPKFGKIDLADNNITTVEKQLSKRTIQFFCENIKIELKEGYNKNFLRNIVEVLNNAN